MFLIELNALMVHRIAIAHDRSMIDCNHISNTTIAMRCAFDKLQLIHGCTGMAISIGDFNCNGTWKLLNCNLDLGE